MRLARKLTWTIILGICLILTVEGLLHVRREGRMLEEDLRHDHAHIGRLVATALAEAAPDAGWSEAMARIGRSFEQGGAMRIRQVPEIPARGAGMHDGRFWSYVPLPAGGPVKGFVEISESTEGERAYMHESTLRAIIVTIAMGVLASLLSTLLGYRLIGVPMRRLADKARRVGLGQLDQPLILGQRDELGELAREMNLMCERLAEANARVATESQARLAAMEALRHADRLATVGKLASGIAHELGTPLNVISARARMIENREGSLDELSSYGRIVVEQTQRITRIIRQLLDFARGGAANPTAASKAATAAVDLRPLAKGMSQMLAPLAQKRGVMVTLVESSGAATVKADQGLIEQAVANLVVNAIQASSSGGAITIEVGARSATPPVEIGGPEATFVALAVRDQGSGISPQDLPRIFEPFFTTKQVGEGTGLGLSVAYGIAREHGGWISVESQPGAGSCFTILLPSA